MTEVFETREAYLWHGQPVGTTARKYKVGFALFLQSMAQLQGQYGTANATVIQEALATEIYLPGMALDTARSLEARLGRSANTCSL